MSGGLLSTGWWSAGLYVGVLRYRLCDALAQFLWVFVFILCCEFPSGTVVPIDAPRILFPFFVVSRFAEALKFFGICQECCFLWALASPHARVEFDFLGVAVFEDGLHARHLPYAGVCRALGGESFPVFDAIAGDLGAEVGDGVSLLHFDGVGVGHFSW